MTAEAAPCEAAGCGRLTRSKLRVCRSNPVCNAERVRRRYIVKKLGGLVPAEFSQPVPCGICGGLTPSPYGVCSRKQQLTCRAEYERRRRYATELGRIPDEWPVLRRCQRCGGSIQADNKYGFCQQNPECERARDRLKSLAWYQGNLAVARERLRSDSHREASRRWTAMDRVANPGKYAAAAKRYLQRTDRPCRVGKCDEFAMVGQRECRPHKQESSRIWRREQREGTIRKLAERQDWICTWCGADLPEDLAGCEIDHVIPKSITLIEEDWNKALLHWWCNAEKWNYITPGALELAREHGVDLGARYVAASPPRELMAKVSP